MKTQDQNPAYRRFRSNLPINGRYPAKDVDIHWNRDDDRRVRDVEIVFWPKQLVPSPARDPEFITACHAYTKRWDSNEDTSARPPEEIFGWLVSDGFAENAELKRALEEFAGIEECGWAREIVKGFSDE